MSHDACEILEKVYKVSLKVKVVKLQMLRRDFESLSMKEMKVLNVLLLEFKILLMLFMLMVKLLKIEGL